MKPETVRFPPDIKIVNGNLRISIENPVTNIVSINKTDYVPYYLNNDRPGNPGPNSFIIKLIAAQNFDEDIGYPLRPDLVMKICKKFYGKYSEPVKSERFKREILALLECKQYGLQNIIDILGHGGAEIASDNGVVHHYRYYLMEYADSNMLTHIASKKMSFYERVELCLELCEGLKQLWSRGLYHRDIKPENIQFIAGRWVICDLGLANHRDDDSQIDDNDLWIGPRGWMSPEAMNRFLTLNTRFQDDFDLKIDHQSDIYQLGKVLWFILQGNAPEGGVRRRDFLSGNDSIYSTVRTMINNAKRSRFKDIDEVITCLRRILKALLKHELVV